MDDLKQILKDLQGIDGTITSTLLTLEPLPQLLDRLASMLHAVADSAQAATNELIRRQRMNP